MAQRTGAAGSGKRATSDDEHAAAADKRPRSAPNISDRDRDSDDMDDDDVLTDATRLAQLAVVAAAKRPLTAPDSSDSDSDDMDDDVLTDAQLAASRRAKAGKRPITASDSESDDGDDVLTDATRLSLLAAAEARLRDALKVDLDDPVFAAWVNAPDSDSDDDSDDDSDGGDDAPVPKKERSEAQLAKSKRRKEKKSTVTTGLAGVVDHALAAAGAPAAFDPEDLLKRIDTVVVAGSQAAYLASELLVLHLALDLDSKVTDVNQALCAAALRLVCETGTTAKARNEPDLRATFARYRETFPAGFPFPDLRGGQGNTLNGLARDMAANFKVYHEQSLEAHVKRYLRDAHGLIAAAAVAIWSSMSARVLAGWTPTQAETDALNLAQRDAVHLAVTLRDKGPACVHRVLLDRLEEHNADQPDTSTMWSLFALAPLRSIGRQFVVIDSHLLHHSWGLPETLTIASFFPKRPGYSPGAEIKTDGVRASLPYAKDGVTPEDDRDDNAIRELGGKPGKKEKKRKGRPRGKVDVRNVKRCLVTLTDTKADPAILNEPLEAFDPGKHDLLVGSNGTKVSRVEWETWRGTKQAQAEIERRKRVWEIHAYDNVLSRNHLNSADPDVLLARLTHRHDIVLWHMLWAFYGARWRARQRFGLKMREQAAYARLATRVLGPQRDRVCVLGSAVFNASQPGLPPTPTLSIRRYLSRFGRVVLVWEHRTSKTCNLCGSEMLKHPEVWSIYSCKSCKITWSRDVNASRNLHKVFRHHHLGLARPAHLCRQPRH